MFVFRPIGGVEFEPGEALTMQLDLTPVPLGVCGFIESPPCVAGRAVEEIVVSMRADWADSVRALIVFHLLTSLCKPLSMA